MSKKIIIIITLLVIVVCILPILLNIIISFDAPIYKVAQQNDWISFFGSYVGSIIGGLCTLVGVIIAFKLDKEKKYFENLPEKMNNLNEINSLIRSDEFFRFHKEVYSVVQKLSEKEILEKVIDFLKNHIGNEKQALSLAIKTTPKIYGCTNTYFLNLKMFYRHSETIRLLDISEEKNINKRTIIEIVELIVGLNNWYSNCSHDEYAHLAKDLNTKFIKPNKNRMLTEQIENYRKTVEAEILTRVDKEVLEDFEQKVARSKKIHEE